MIGAPLVVMSRLVLAPRAHVFAAWSRPERMARWWSAEHAGGTAAAIGGGAHRVGGVIVRVIAERPGEHLVFTWGGDDPETRSRISVTFTDEAGGTRVAIQQSSASPRCSLDRLAALLQAVA